MSKSKVTRLSVARVCAAVLLASQLAAHPALAQQRQDPLPRRPSSQETPQLPRIGILSGYGRVAIIGLVERELEGLGWLQGKTVMFEERYSTGPTDQLPLLAKELVQAKVDVIVAITSTAAVAVRGATTTIPTVVLGAHDGVAVGLFESLARPGMNLTGSESLAPLLDEKRAELMRLMVPRVSNLAIIFNPRNPSAEPHLKSTRAIAQKLGITITLVPVEGPNDFAGAYAILDRPQIDAAISYTDEVTFATPMFDYQKTRKLPMVCEYEYQVRLGCLFSYGPLIGQFATTTAQQVDKILKGANPAELPVQLMTRYELVINRTTARELGLAIPAQFSIRADKIVD